MKLVKYKIRPKIIIFLFLGLVLIIILSGFIGFFWYFNTFTKTINEKPGHLFGQIVDGVKNPYSEDYLHLLILGLDRRPGEISSLTDTILVVSFNVNTGDYLLFSIPRDLWLPDLQTKVNALYYYGQQLDPNDGTDMMSRKIEELLDIEIDHTIVLEMGDIESLVNMVGGITVDVERSFDDHMFPLDDGSHQVMTVKFEQGEQNFDGEKALQFMRSRQSEDEIEGTDQARQIRQKKVILAIRDKLLKSNQIIKSPTRLGELYNFVTQEIKIKPQLTIGDMASFWGLGKNLPKGSVVDAELPWRLEDEGRILEYGYIDFDGKYIWVMFPKNNDWDLITDFYHEKLPM